MLTCPLIFDMLIECGQIRSTKHLLGRAGERFLLFGMLMHSKEGKLCLEDDDGVVELVFPEKVRMIRLRLYFPV